MKGKIIATLMALGMVLTAFSLLAVAEEQPQPLGTPHTGSNQVYDGTGTQAIAAYALRGADALPNTADDQANGISYSWDVTQGAFNPSVTVTSAGWTSYALGFPINLPGTWRNRSDLGAPFRSRTSYDIGSIWDVWAAGDYAVQFNEVFNTNTTTFRNYTNCMEQVMTAAASDSFGTTTYMEQIHVPTLVSNVGNTCTIRVAPMVAPNGIEVAALDDGYRVYKSTTGPITAGNPGVMLGDCTNVAGQWEYADASHTADSYYAVKVKWEGGTTPFAARYSFGTSDDLYVAEGGVTTYGPEATALTASPNPHNGQVLGVYDRVFINATITDTEAPADNINAAEFQVEVVPASGVYGASVAMSPIVGGWDNPMETVTGTYNFPSQFPVGVHSYRVRGSDVADGWNATWVTGTFTVTDTSQCLGAYVAPTPATGTLMNIGSTVTVRASYEDITPYNAANCDLYYRQVGNATWTNVALANNSFAWGSYTNTLQATFPVWGPAATTIEYYVTLDDIGGGGLLTLATRNVVAFQATGPQSPYPIFGRVYLYNGNAGVYTPILAGAGVPVTVAWVNSTTGAYSTIAGTTIATGQYSIDILNYTNGGTVLINATFSAPYNNRGYNFTIIDNVTSPGGRYMNVVCGIPYDVDITTPIAGASVIGGVAFPATYRFLDIDGLVAQGYYTHVDGQMLWRSNDPAFVPPAGRTFNGIGTVQPVTDNLVLFTPVNRWINISEGGALELNPYLTPWGAIYRLPGSLGPMWLKDWENITLTVTAGGFDWRLIRGWNMVSAPQNPTFRQGLNVFFDSEDALVVCFGMTADPGMQMAVRTGGEPSTYNSYNYGGAEAGAFAVDSVHGYWVYLAVAGPFVVHFNAINWTGAGINTINLAPGWNTVGFTRNYTTTGWTNLPNAADWTNGAIDVDLNIAGPLTKIVATYWMQNVQWYNSYVTTDTFPGMGTHDWLWDTTYSTNPGNGCWIWVNAATAVTFNVNQ